MYSFIFDLPKNYNIYFSDIKVEIDQSRLDARGRIKTASFFKTSFVYYFFIEIWPIWPENYCNFFSIIHILCVTIV